MRVETRTPVTEVVIILDEGDINPRLLAPQDISASTSSVITKMDEVRRTYGKIDKFVVPMKQPVAYLFGIPVFMEDAK